MGRILLVEDEAELAELVRGELMQAGHNVVVTSDGPSAVSVGLGSPFDIVILDLMLPGFDGLEVTRRIRSKNATPILMLTAKSTELDKVLGLELGADDYLTKPFSMRELLARVNAILRRSEMIRSQSATQQENAILTYPGLHIDLPGHEVVVAGVRISLTATEFALLRLLASNPGRVFSREFLLEEVWGDEIVVFDRTIDSHIQRLRKKLGGVGVAGDYIETVWGVGYRFSARLHE